MEHQTPQPHPFRNRIFSILRILILPGLCLALLLLARLWEDAACRRMEGEIRRALLYVYAAEGVYPQSFTDFADAYGLALDETAYLVRYLPLGENVMPDVQVFRRGRRP